MLHKIPSLFPWKHNKTKIMAETVLEEVNLEEQLAPCGICGRTFLPAPLVKHTRVCEKNATKKRKIFNSLKQRVEGTDLAAFHQKTYLKKAELLTKPIETPPIHNNWKEKHQQLVSTIRAAKGSTDNLMSTTTTKRSRKMNSLNATVERCPTCERQFGPKAFDRHVEWCKERKARLPQSPANIQEAKERLDARIKYRVPPMSKTRKTVKEKYQSPMRNEIPTVKSTSCLERKPSMRKSSQPTLKKSTKSPERIMKPPEIKHRVKSPEKPKKPEPMKSSGKRAMKINSPRVNSESISLTVSQLNTPFLAPKKLVTWNDIIRIAPGENTPPIKEIKSDTAVILRKKSSLIPIKQKQLSNESIDTDRSCTSMEDDKIIVVNPESEDDSIKVLKEVGQYIYSLNKSDSEVYVQECNNKGDGYSLEVGGNHYNVVKLSESNQHLIPQNVSLLKQPEEAKDKKDFLKNILILVPQSRKAVKTASTLQFENDSLNGSDEEVANLEECNVLNDKESAVSVTNSEILNVETGLVKEEKPNLIEIKSVDKFETVLNVVEDTNDAKIVEEETLKIEPILEATAIETLEESKLEEIECLPNTNLEETIVTIQAEEDVIEKTGSGLQILHERTSLSKTEIVEVSEDQLCENTTTILDDLEKASSLVNLKPFEKTEIKEQFLEKDESIEKTATMETLDKGEVIGNSETNKTLDYHVKSKTLLLEHYKPSENTTIIPQENIEPSGSSENIKQEDFSFGDTETTMQVLDVQKALKSLSDPGNIDADIMKRFDTFCENFNIEQNKEESPKIIEFIDDINKTQCGDSFVEIHNNYEETNERYNRTIIDTNYLPRISEELSMDTSKADTLKSGELSSVYDEPKEDEIENNKQKKLDCTYNSKSIKDRMNLIETRKSFANNFEDILEESKEESKINSDLTDDDDMKGIREDYIPNKVPKITPNLVDREKYRHAFYYTLSSESEEALECTEKTEENNLSAIAECEISDFDLTCSSFADDISENKIIYVDEIELEGCITDEISLNTLNSKSNTFNVVEDLKESISLDDTIQINNPQDLNEDSSNVNKAIEKSDPNIATSSSEDTKSSWITIPNSLQSQKPHCTTDDFTSILNIEAEDDDQRYSKACIRYLELFVENESTQSSCTGIEITDSLINFSFEKLNFDIDDIIYVNNDVLQDVESLQGVYSNPYTSALSKARLERELRHCCSDVALNHNYDYTNFLTYSETELSKFHRLQCLVKHDYDRIPSNDEILEMAGDEFITNLKDQETIYVNMQVTATQTSDNSSESDCGILYDPIEPIINIRSKSANNNRDDPKTFATEIYENCINENIKKIKKRKSEILENKTIEPVKINESLHTLRNSVSIIDAISEESVEDKQVTTVSSTSTISNYPAKFINLVGNILEDTATGNLNISRSDCKRLVDLDTKKLAKIKQVKLPTIPIKEVPIIKKQCEVIVLPNINTNDRITDDEKRSDNNGAENRDEYNPILTAERQLMELLECDDFKPFKSTPPKNDKTKKKVNNNNNKRASVIDPPYDFKDTSDIFDDNFELIENFINDNFNDEEILNKLDFDTISLCSKTSFSSHNQDNNYTFCDDLSIDPRLINEYDNLSIPEHLSIEGHSPIDALPHNKFLDNHKLPALEPMVFPKTEKSNELNDFLTSLGSVETKSCNKNSRLPKNSQQNPCSFGRPTSPREKKKNLSALKRNISILDPVKPKCLKNPEDVQNYFHEQDMKHSNSRKVIEEPVVDDLFPVDDEMYEEYKKYEQMYLQEKEEKMRMEQRKGQSEDETVVTTISGDSAYGSLSRNKPKVRSRVAKLSPLEHRLDSASSSGSDTAHDKKHMLLDENKLSKFCHECGNKHPLTTAKFCVECGIRRLPCDDKSCFTST